MSALNKSAKVLSEPQIRAALGHVQHSRYPLRDRVMILLSVKAGLRAKEIACLTWAMVTDAEGTVADAIHLTNGASKGKRGGRTIPLNFNLREALVSLKAATAAADRQEFVEAFEDYMAGAAPILTKREPGDALHIEILLRDGAQPVV